MRRSRWPRRGARRQPWRRAGAAGLVELESAPDWPRKPEHLRVRAEHEEDAGEQRALQHRAGNGSQRIAHLAAQRGCALEADKTEDGEHQSRPERAERNAFEPELAGIELKADVHRQQDEHDHDQADRDGFNPQHDFSGKLDVAVGNVVRRRRRPQRAWEWQAAPSGRTARERTVA